MNTQATIKVVCHHEINALGNIEKINPKQNK